MDTDIYGRKHREGLWHNGKLPNRYSALYLKLPEAGLSLFLLANSDALSMPFKLALGDISSSAFACAFRTIIAPGRRRDRPRVVLFLTG
jgi:hypothetical protein